MENQNAARYSLQNFRTAYPLQTNLPARPARFRLFSQSFLRKNFASFSKCGVFFHDIFG